MAIASTELHWETDYLREASCMDKFRSAISSPPIVVESSGHFYNRELLGDDEIFSVPKVIHPLTSKRVLTSELVYGVPLDHLTDMDENIKNWVSKMVTDHFHILFHVNLFHIFIIL